MHRPKVEDRFADDLLGGIRPKHRLECRAVSVVDPDVADDERGVWRRFDRSFLKRASLWCSSASMHAFSGADIANHDLAGGHPAVHDRMPRLTSTSTTPPSSKTDRTFVPTVPERQRLILHHGAGCARGPRGKCRPRARNQAARGRSPGARPSRRVVSARLASSRKRSRRPD